MSSPTRLIFGCGYLGQRVAERWLAAGDRVVAVTRSAERARALAELGIEPVVADITQLESLRGSLPDCQTCLFAVGFDRSQGSGSIGQVYSGGMRNVLEVLPHSIGRVIYISTTGVYGGAGGEWVDEQTPPGPTREGGIASLEAEDALRGSPLADRGVVLRLAGIYGPGRVPFLELMQRGEAVPASPTGWLNLIHVEDAAEIAAMAVSSGVPGPLYCVSDGNPAPRADYYAEVARLAGGPPPTFVPPDPGSPRALRASADKRVSNRLLRGDLKLQLRFPDYRVGLAAILGSGGSSR